MKNLSLFLLLLLANNISAQDFTKVTGGIWDVQSKEPIRGIGVHYLANQGKHIFTASDDTGHFEFVDKIMKDEVGKLFVHGNSSTQNSNRRYLNSTTTINSNPHFSANAHHKNFYLQCANCGEIRLPGIYFALGKWSLLVSDEVNCEDSLKQLLDVLHLNPNITVELQSHTDARGSDKANQLLSQKRAEYCVDKLIEWGANPGRITAKGYGESKLLISDEEIYESTSNEQKERHHAMNRRTSFMVTSFDYSDTSSFQLKYKLAGAVYDVDTKEPLGNVKVKLSGTDGSICETITDPDGFYNFVKCTNGRCIKPMTSYTIEIDAMDEPASNEERYLGMKGQESTVGVLESTAYVKDFYLQIATGGYGGLLPTFPFNRKSAKLIENDKISIKDSLDIIVQLMEENPSIILEISGHTDSRFRESKSEVLSQKRSDVVMAYLVSNGAEPLRLIPKGYSDAWPVISDDQIETLPKNVRKKAHEKNNRVTFNVLSFDYKE